MTSLQGQIARFGTYEADLQRRILTKSGLRVRVQEQPFQVLTLLLEKPGEVVTRDEIRMTLWSADTYVAFDDGLNTAIKKLRTALGDTAENPRFIETVPRRGYRFVAPVSFASAVVAGAGTRIEPLVAVLENPSKSVSAAPQNRPSTAGFWTGTVRLALLLAVAGAAVVVYRGALTKNGGIGRAAAPDPVLHPRVSVAVMGFQNLSRRREQAWLSPALAEMMASELAAGEQLRTVPGETVARARRDLGLPDSDSYAGDTLLQIRQNLGADFVVVGSYFDLGRLSGGTVRLDLRMQDARTGETVASMTKAGTEADLPTLAALAGGELRRHLGASVLTKAQETNLRAELPSNSEAAQLYAEGLTRLRAFDSMGARVSLEKAIEAEGSFALAHSALAEAWASLGYDNKAREESERALDLSSPLSREQRMWVEGHYQEAIHDWDRAIASYGELLRLFPDNVEYGLRLAAVQNSAARSAESLETLKRLRKLPTPSGVDPRLDIVAAQAEESLGDYTQEQKLSAHAADSAAAMGASLIAAAGRHLQCWALSRFGKMEQALAACSDAQQIYARAGDRDSVARVLITSGSVLEEKGQFAPAKQRYDEAIAIHRSVGDEGGEALALNVLAVLGVDSGHYASGRALYEQSTALARKNGNQDGVILGLGNLANLALLEGDLPAARNRYDELIRICRELNSKNRIALQLGNLGDVLYLQGDLPAAHRALEESIALNTETGEKRQLSYALLSLGELLQAEDRLDEARLKKMQALDLQVSMDNKVEAADGQVALAASSIEEGHPDAAIDTLRKAIVELRALKSEDEEAQAYPILADALLHMGNVPEARRTIEHGAAVNAKSRNRMVQLSFAVEEARVRGASGDAASATKILTRLIAETKRSGFYGYQLEARLALAEIESRSATNSGLARLRTLAQDANAHGFQLIARKAAVLSERARGSAVAHAG